MLLLKLSSSLSTLFTHLEEPFELDSNQQFHVLLDSPVNKLKYTLFIVNTYILLAQIHRKHITEVLYHKGSDCTRLKFLPVC